jgi:hypothetical protein
LADFLFIPSVITVSPVRPRSVCMTASNISIGLASGVVDFPSLAFHTRHPIATEHLNGLTLRAFGHQRVVRDQESDARFSGPWVGALLNNGGVPVQCILPLSPSAVHQENKRTVCVRRRESLTHVMLTTVYFNGETMLKTCRDRAANPCSLKI